MGSARPPSSRRRLFALAISLCVAWLIGVAAPVFADDHRPGAAVVHDETQAAPGERELLGRLIAPCCWNQTLDIHAGGTPDQLRAEIRSRLQAGETPAAIEADFVARYGERVRASSHSTSLGTAGFVVIGLALAAGIAIIYAIRRWLRAARPAQESAATATEPDGLDARLDEELRAMD
jgi:cytochrome c-type biogenesis protein CcmH